MLFVSAQRDAFLPQLALTGTRFQALDVAIEPLDAVAESQHIEHVGGELCEVGGAFVVPSLLQQFHKKGTDAAVGRDVLCAMTRQTRGIKLSSLTSAPYSPLAG